MPQATKREPTRILGPDELRRECVAMNAPEAFGPVMGDPGYLADILNFGPFVAGCGNVPEGIEIARADNHTEAHLPAKGCADNYKTTAKAFSL